MQAQSYELHPTLVLIKTALMDQNTGFVAELNRRESTAEKTIFLNNCKKFVEGQSVPQFNPEFLNNMNNDTEKIFFTRLALLNVVANVTRDNNWHQTTKTQLKEIFNKSNFNLTFKNKKINQFDDLKNAFSPKPPFPALRFIVVGLAMFSMAKSYLMSNASIPTQIKLSWAIAGLAFLAIGLRLASIIQNNRLAPFYSENARRELHEGQQMDRALFQLFLARPENLPQLQNNR